MLPLDNISKCRAILPAELPESRAARMAVNPKRRRSLVGLYFLHRLNFVAWVCCRLIPNAVAKAYGEELSGYLYCAVWTECG